MPRKLQDLIIEDSGVATDPATGESFLLTGTALPLIRLLRNGADESALLQFLLDEYEIDHSTAHRDLDFFLQTLNRLHWLEETS